MAWDCRIHRLLLCREIRLRLLDECPRYDTKQSDSEAPVMLELWRIRSTSLLPSLPGPLWPGMVATHRFLSIGQIELNCVLILNWVVWNRTVLYAILNSLKKNLFMLNWIACNRTVLTIKLCTYAKPNCWNRIVFDIKTVYLC